MDKLNYLKTTKQSFRDWCRISRSYRQASYKDAFLQKGEKVPFRHDWAMMSHMHDLRVWTLAYAPSQLNNLRRLQEIHLLNNEMWYMVQNALWKRILAMIVLWFAVNKFFKKKYLEKGMEDS